VNEGVRLGRVRRADIVQWGSLRDCSGDDGSRAEADIQMFE
jgi:hypothetical protein